jgi:XXXCH domain-containing protein
MDFRALKAEMETAFRHIRESTVQGELPDQAQVSIFVRDARQMHVVADEAWLGEAEDFAHISEKLLQAVKASDVGDAVLCVEALHEAQIYCHRLFKD